MGRITKEWIDEQIEREMERGNTPAAINDLAMLATVRQYMMDTGKWHEDTPRPVKAKAHGLSAEEAQAWVHDMEAADKNCKSGGKWTWEEAQRVAEDRGIHSEGQMMIDFYAALNMVYSVDFC